MGGFSLAHWIIVLLVILILFGAGRLPRVMGDIGRGLRSFREGLRGEEEKKHDIPPDTKEQ